MKTYVVTIGGIDHTMQLSDEDAKAKGLKAAEPEQKAATPPNKARNAPNKKA